MLINRQKDLESLCQRMRGSGGAVALDTEFMSERRYTPKLCLVQVYAESMEGDIEALVDPFAVVLDPLLEIVTDPQVTKIVHAGGQDIAIFAQCFGCVAQSVFDTQIAAAFLGYGHQVGYADLVKRVLGGPQLSKEMQFTDWASRPLSSGQIDYALADVRYLPALHKALKNDLSSRGRIDWALAEFRRAESKASELPSDADLYRRFNLSGLTRRRLGALRELAAVRESFARNADRPPNFVIPDAVMLQLAKQPPSNLAELRAVRGMPSISAAQSRQVLEALERAEKLAPEQLPERPESNRPDPRADAVTTMMGVVVQSCAAQHNISRTYLAPRDQLQALAMWWLAGEPSPPDLEILRGWRGSLLGQDLLDLLAGRLRLALDQNAARASDDSPVVRVLRAEVR